MSWKAVEFCEYAHLQIKASIDCPAMLFSSSISITFFSADGCHPRFLTLAEIGASIDMKSFRVPRSNKTRRPEECSIKNDKAGRLLLRSCPVIAGFIKKDQGMFVSFVVVSIMLTETVAPGGIVKAGGPSDAGVSVIVLRQSTVSVIGLYEKHNWAGLFNELTVFKL